MLQPTERRLISTISPVSSMMFSMIKAAAEALE